MWFDWQKADRENTKAIRQQTHEQVHGFGLPLKGCQEFGQME